MKQELQITASIVLYKEDPEVLQSVVRDFLRIPLTKKLFLISNSAQDDLSDFDSNPEIECCQNPANFGFGKGHNTILTKIEKLSKYHLILNADVEFDPQVIPRLMEAIGQDSTVSMVAPRVLYPNGDLQFTCRKYPSFLHMIQRFLNISKKSIEENEYRNLDLNKPFYPEFVHGCFMLFRTSHFVGLGGFDERFFMYMEDADICKRIAQEGNTKLYFPKEKIIHAHRKGSSKSVRLFFLHVVSAIKYFNKWGY